jgi:hypothetical protein
MAVKMIADEGQTLTPPRGKVLGVVDTQQQMDEVVLALKKAGFDKVTAVHEEDGLNLLEQVDGFFFSDGNERILNRHIAELQAGHLIFAVQTPSRQAEEAAQVAAENGARFLVHIGFATTTWLVK